MTPGGHATSLTSRTASAATPYAQASDLKATAWNGSRVKARLRYEAQGSPCVTLLCNRPAMTGCSQYQRRGSNIAIAPTFAPRAVFRSAMMKHAVCSLLMSLVVCSQPDSGRVMTIASESGRVRGTGADVIAYRGIPYAAPPIGPRRWRPPDPPARWSDVRNATEFGPVCPQAPLNTSPPPALMSEDCLTLNVWT